MTWIVEIDVEDVASGPLHGELVAVIGDALREYAPGWHTGLRVTWRNDDVTHVTQVSTTDTQRDAVESAHRRDTYPAQGTEAP